MSDGGEKTQLSMTPSPDLSSLQVRFNTEANTSVLNRAEPLAGQAARYMNENLTLSGVGERVTFFWHDEAGFTCDPVPSQTEAPFNWGDPSEGAAVSHESAEAVRANIVGMWRSVEDPLSLREFLSSGSVIDTYDDKEPYRQGWTVFTKNDVGTTTLGFTPEAGLVYINMREGGDFVPGMFFSVDKLTADELEMTFMDRGNKLTYKRVQ
jgi:hypothetical protein